MTLSPLVITLWFTSIHLITVILLVVSVVQNRGLRRRLMANEVARTDAIHELSVAANTLAEKQAAIAKTLATTTASVVETLDTKTDRILENTTQIHTLTNSTNSNLQKQIEVLQAEKRGLETRMALMDLEKKETAARQAATDVQLTAAIRSVPAVPFTPPPVAAAVNSTLKQIEVNTAETAANTARTDEKVAAMSEAQNGTAAATEQER